jgi:hypothetical protein
MQCQYVGGTFHCEQNLICTLPAEEIIAGWKVAIKGWEDRLFSGCSPRTFNIKELVEHKECREMFAIPW